MHLGGTYPTNRVWTACLDNTATRALSSSGYLTTQPYEALIGSAEAQSLAGTSAAEGCLADPAARAAAREESRGSCVRLQLEREEPRSMEREIDTIRP